MEQMRQLSDVERVDLSALTRELLAALEPRLRLKGLTVVDELGTGVVVDGNRFLLAQALHNLLDNAIDFSPPGGRLTLHAAPVPGGGVEWSVRDQGRGVPGYAQAHIFDRFYSLPRSETQDKSSGLGLCLVKEVSDLHGGDIRVGNVEGGCLARWHLPA